MKNSVYRLINSDHIWLVAIIPVCQLGNAFSLIYTFCIVILCIIIDDVSVY